MSISSSVTCRTRQPKGDWILLGGAGGSSCSPGHGSAWATRLQSTVYICNCYGRFSCGTALPASNGLKPFQTMQKSLGALFKKKTIIFNRGDFQVRHYEAFLHSPSGHSSIFLLLFLGDVRCGGEQVLLGFQGW